MPADGVNLDIAIATYGHTAAVKDGSVPIAGVKPNFIEVVPIIGAFRRMVRDVEFDVCEMAPTTYMIARASGAPFIALPIFVMRRFHHAGFVVRPDSGITVPKDLEGKKVGVRAYSVTTGVWTRGIFINEYGLDSSKVTWVVDDEEHVATLELPPNVIHAPPGKSLASMMASGELQAGFTGPAGIGRGGPADRQLGARRPGADPSLPGTHSRCRQGRGRLVPPHWHLSDPRHHRGQGRGAGQAPPCRARLCSMPSRPPRQPYLERLKAGVGSAPEDVRYRSFLPLMSDPLPYGIRANQASIEALITYALQQGLIPKRPAVSDVFFDPEAA